MLPELAGHLLPHGVTPVRFPHVHLHGPTRPLTLLMSWTMQCRRGLLPLGLVTKHGSAWTQQQSDARRLGVPAHLGLPVWDQMPSALSSAFTSRHAWETSQLLQEAGARNQRHGVLQQASQHTSAQHSTAG